MELGLRGKRALVTGGSSGIGFAIARALCEEGVEVVVASRYPEHVEAAVATLRQAFPQQAIRGETLDVADEASVRTVWGRLPDIDILVNNTGGPATGLPTQLALEAWDKGYHALVRSVLLTAQLAAPGMQGRGWGRILTITSTSAREIISRLPISSTFRAGLTALTKELAKELGRSGILVNNLLPGPTRTDRLKHLATDSPAFFQAMESETAVGRIAEPEEIARVAAFLCSNANTYITGTDILADGGYTRAL